MVFSPFHVGNQTADASHWADGAAAFQAAPAQYSATDQAETSRGSAEDRQ